MSLFYLLNPKFYEAGGVAYVASQGPKEEKVEEEKAEQPKRKKSLNEMKRLVVKMLEALED